MSEFSCVFISHRSYDRDKARELRDGLLSNNISTRVILWEEESLCRNNEQLTVHDYFEAIERIKRSMETCTAFLYIDSPVFFNGYFTSAELLQWRRIHDKPYVYRVWKGEGNFLYEKVELVPLTKREKSQISFVSYWSSSDRLYDTEGGAMMDSWGKYAKECFIVGCCACGKYYLMTKKKMDKYVLTQLSAICPHCNQYHAKFTWDLKGKKFFGNRIPILINPLVRKIADHEPLSVEDVIDLLNAKKLPKRFPLDKLPDEKLKSDYRKQFTNAIKTTAKIVGIVYTVRKVISMFDEK